MSKPYSMSEVKTTLLLNTVFSVPAIWFFIAMAFSAGSGHPGLAAFTTIIAVVLGVILIWQYMRAFAFKLIDIYEKDETPGHARLEKGSHD